jgi:hypothetical protein
VPDDPGDDVPHPGEEAASPNAGQVGGPGAPDPRHVPEAKDPHLTEPDLSLGDSTVPSGTRTTRPIPTQRSTRPIKRGQVPTHPTHPTSRGCSTGRNAQQRGTDSHRSPLLASAESERRAEEGDELPSRFRESLRVTQTVEEVTDALAALSAEELDATWSALLLPERERNRLRRIDGRHVEPSERDFASVISSTSGPAAVAIAQRRLLVFKDVATLLARFPEVGRWGRPPAAGAVAFAPLLLADEALGCAVLWWESEHPVATIEPPRLTALARCVAKAVDRIEAAAEQRADAETLQRSLLTQLPRPDGLELYARYVPAGRGREIGGDWYDAVVLDDGSTALMIGDVTGHDMSAAAQMGQLRGLLRAFAYDRNETPSGIVNRLDRACAGLGIDTLATLIVAHLEGVPAKDGSVELSWTNAGHLPPILLRPDGRTELLDTPPESLLGLVPCAARSDHTRRLSPGTILLLYTDGLVEHRGRDARTGTEQLQARLTRLHRLPLPTMLNMLVSQMAGDQTKDDVALLAVRSRWAPPTDR